MRALAGIAFVVLTAPVAAHMIGRAAYLLDLPMWEGTHVDELENRYNRQSGHLASTFILLDINNLGQNHNGSCLSNSRN